MLPELHAERGQTKKALLILLAIFGVIAIGIILLVVLTGVGLFFAASGAEESPSPGDDVPDVDVRTVGATPTNATYSLDVAWNSRAQSAVDPDPNDFSGYDANDGEKYLVFRLSITNTGSEDIELTQSLFQVESDGVQYEPQVLFGSGNSISDVTLTPDSTYSGWIAYSLPEDASSAEVLVNQDAYYDETVAVDFDVDGSMAINMSD